MTIIDQKPQHLSALDRANQVRLGRAELKREVASGERSAADVILEPPEVVASMTVADLLMSQHRWGRRRTRSALAAVMVPELKSLGSLTDRQREVLAAFLRGESVDPLTGRLRPAVALEVVQWMTTRDRESEPWYSRRHLRRDDDYRPLCGTEPGGMSTRRETADCLTCKRIARRIGGAVDGALVT